MIDPNIPRHLLPHILTDPQTGRILPVHEREDCSACIYIGPCLDPSTPDDVHALADFYLHVGQRLDNPDRITVLIRYGSDGPDYQSVAVDILLSRPFQQSREFDTFRDVVDRMLFRYGPEIRTEDPDVPVVSIRATVNVTTYDAVSL